MFNFLRKKLGQLKFKKKTKITHESFHNYDSSELHESDDSESHNSELDEIFEKIDNAAIKIQKIVRKNIEICPICLNNYFHNKNKILLSCGHNLHLSCFNKLIRFNIHRCPLCRKYVEQLNNNRRFVEIILDEALINALSHMVEI